jgi:hypothetical protein
MPACNAQQGNSSNARQASSNDHSSPAFSENNSKSAGRQPKTLTVDLGDGVTMELVLVPAGKFMMGSPEDEERSVSVGKLVESPPHQVEIKQAFYMSKYEVTNAQFRRFKPEYNSGSNNRIDFPSESIEGIDLNGEDQPVASVQWHAAVSFCEWLSRKSGKDIRLPTEAEWNMPVAPAQRRHFTLVRQFHPIWRITMEGTPTAAVQRVSSGRRLRTWEVFRRTPLDCMTCMATCGSGVPIGRIHWIHRRIVSFAAVRGSTTRGPAARRFALPLHPISGALTSVFELWPWQLRNQSELAYRGSHPFSVRLKGAKFRTGMMPQRLRSDLR